MLFLTELYWSKLLTFPENSGVSCNSIPERSSRTRLTDVAKAETPNV
jgi:hypothetical protein